MSKVKEKEFAVNHFPNAGFQVTTCLRAKE